MDKQKNDKIKNNEDLFLIDSLIFLAKKSKSALAKRWLVILTCGVAFSLLGLLASYILKPKYTAELSFAYIDNEKESSHSEVAVLASMYGVKTDIGAENPFNGDNLIEILKSRSLVERTILTPVSYGDSVTTLAELYVSTYKLRSRLFERISLSNLRFPANQKRESFTYLQDSMIFVIYSELIDKKFLTIKKPSKTSKNVNLSFISKNQFLSKTFVDEIMIQLDEAYKQSRAKKNNANIQQMKIAVDSMRILFRNAYYKSLEGTALDGLTDKNDVIVEKKIQKQDAVSYEKIYNDMLESYEAFRLNDLKEIPIIEVFSSPSYPLKITEIKPLEGILFGALFGIFGSSAVILLIAYNKKRFKA